MDKGTELAQAVGVGGLGDNDGLGMVTQAGAYFLIQRGIRQEQKLQRSV